MSSLRQKTDEPDEEEEVTHILTETDPAWVNVHDDLHFLEDGNRFVWASERDGFAHLYRYTLNGNLVNQITEGISDRPARIHLYKKMVEFWKLYL